MKHHPLFIFLAGLLCACQPISEKAPSIHPAADMVLRNGTVISVDAQRSQHQGLRDEARSPAWGC